MKKTNIGFKFKGKEQRLDVYRLSLLEEGIGLMFSPLRNSKPLLFEFEEGSKWLIHSLFVFFPFLAIWMDSENEVVDYKIVKPFTFSVASRKPYKKIIEIPLKEGFRYIWDQFVEKKDLNTPDSSRN